MKTRKKQIKFGHRKQEHYIISKNDFHRKKNQYYKYKYRDNPFKRGYWDYHLLNGDRETLLDNYGLIIDKFNL